MPIYEFFCPVCKKKYSALVGMTAESDDTSCPTCGHKESRRLVSRFARYRNEDQRIDELADSLENISDDQSPTEMRRMMKEMGKALDDDASDEMEEVFEADMAGELGDEE